MLNNKEEIYKREIEKIIDQINDGVPVNYCACSYNSLLKLVQAALNWEIWEEYMLIKSKDPEVIRKLINLFNLK